MGPYLSSLVVEGAMFAPRLVAGHQDAMVHIVD